MISRSVRTMVSMAITAAVISCLAGSEKLVAQSAATKAPNVTYSASGIFASSAVSGQDKFKLAGQPFSIKVVANAATIPTTHGATWAQYTKLKMSGEVTSGLLPGQPPYPISSNLTSMELATGNPSYDVLAIFAPVSVLGAQVNIIATIEMPPGTIKNGLIHPFSAPVTLSPATTTFTYSDSSDSTTLQIASGTVNATIPTPAATTSVQLHAEGVRAVTYHGDGTASLRPVHDAPVDLGAQGEVVSLVFYASGVRDASEVRVQIAGQDAPVLYAGPADRFPGLDEVNVQLPRGLAGTGAADVVLTVDGQTSNPVHIQIQ
jgi:hypothetical protein